VACKRRHPHAGARVKPIKVLLADDQSLVRAGFHALLDAEESIRVVGEATNGREAVEMACASRPDVILMDIQMPGVDGLAATRQVTSLPELAQTKVLVLTTFDHDENVFGALQAGASGFLLKGMEPADLIKAIHVVASGDALLAPTVTRRLIAAYTQKAPTSATQPISLPADISDREKEVLILVATGMNNAEIAGQLFLSPLTVKSHVSRILTKFTARDRVQLVVMAYESQLITPGR